MDEEWRGQLTTAIKRLPPYQVNSLGHLQEWIEDWKSGDQGHNMLGSNQIDASFGLTPGIAEGLLQSHAGEICLLPALPASWPDGSVNGLRASGGFEVSMQWKEGRLVTAEIRNSNTDAAKVRYSGRTGEVSCIPGEAIHLNAELTNVK